MSRKIMSATERRMAAILKETGGALASVKLKMKNKKKKNKNKATFE